VNLLGILLVAFVLALNQPRLDGVIALTASSLVALHLADVGPEGRPSGVAGAGREAA
jgi:hypothetical protein